MGPVSNLGYVTTKPYIGVASQACVIGHGYIVGGYTSAVGHYYARFYTIGWIKGTGSDTIGVQIKWQYPYNP